MTPSVKVSASGVEDDPPCTGQASPHVTAGSPQKLDTKGEFEREG